jgi:hypothetical protein
LNLRESIELDQPLIENREMSVWSEAIPLRERLLDRMADLLFCADDGLTMLASEGNEELYKECAGSLRIVFDSVNELMKKLCD